jgi:mycothiol synthase
MESRAIEIPQDVWPVRDFLSDLWPLVPLGTVWEVRRWDGSLFYGERPGLEADRAAKSRLWEDESSRILAAVLSEGGRQIHPHVRPEAADLLPAVVAWGETAAVAADDDRVLLGVWDGDDAMYHVAGARGYRATDGWEIVRSMHAAETPPPEVAEGYTLRTTRDDPADDQAIADLLNASFGRMFHVAAEHAGFTRHAPSFLRETDLVAVASDGMVAAYAAVCWDRRNRNAIFEPVCTHPDHRRRGLARALMLEGMRRAFELGALTIEVGTGDADPANSLYASLPFTDERRARLWAKDL